MKKLLAILLVAAMLLCLAACDKDTPVDSQPAATQPAATQPAATEPAATEPPIPEYPTYEFTQYGNAKVSIVGAEFATDDSDETFLRVYYDYTNTGDSAAGQTPDYTLDFMSVTQDGQEVDEFGLYSDDSHAVFEDLLEDVCVLPGVTVRKTRLFECDPEGGVIDFSCYVMVGSWMYNPDETELFTFQLDPSDLPGAPAEPMVYPPVPDPTYTKGMVTSGTSTSGTNPFEISLNGYELTTWDDKPALRVKMTYTSHMTMDGDWAPMTCLPITAYQDGLSLAWGDTWYLEDVTAEDEAFETGILAGETVECNAIFVLRTESPVEVVIEQPLDDLRAGMICHIA